MIRLSLATLALALVFTGCDLFGSSDDDPEASEVIVIGTEVDADFLNTGRFGLSATPLDVEGSAILNENIQAEVELRPASNQASVELEQSIDIVASVEVERVRRPSGNDLVVPVNLDGSGSMSWTDPDRNRVDAAKAFYDELETINVPFESGVYEFPGANQAPDFSFTRVFQDLTNDTDALRNAVDNATASGGTPMWESLAELLIYSEDQRPNNQFEKAIVLLGDGAPNGGIVPRDSVCNDANRKNSPIFGVGFGPASDVSNMANSSAVENMRYISDCTGGTYIGVPDDDVESAFAGAFTGFATGTSQGSLSFAVQVESGLDEIRNQGIQRLEGTLRITSGGSTVEGDFLFGVPEPSTSGTFILR
ncbi:MAG: VWA domain-containing protein [Longimonas sp.]|uniref:vWA domain-containing protein n=1 Tax=Longimonas sp. TaxID=2039626 RepID=UPI0033641B64